MCSPRRAKNFVKKLQNDSTRICLQQIEKQRRRSKIGADTKFGQKGLNLTKTHRRHLRRGERFRIGQKLRAYPSYLRIEMRQISYYVSGFGIPLDALERRPPAAPADLLQRLCAAQRVVGWPRVSQTVQHGALNSEKIASSLDVASYGFPRHAKDGGVGGSFSRNFKK